MRCDLIALPMERRSNIITSLSELLKNNIVASRTVVLRRLELLSHFIKVLCRASVSTFSVSYLNPNPPGRQKQA